MKTLTVTNARAKLGHWLKRAAAGESIGIVFGSRVFPLWPSPIEAGDYAEREYGLTTEQVDRAADRIRAEASKTVLAGDYVTAEEFSHAVKSRSGKAGRKGGRKTPAR